MNKLICLLLVLTPALASADKNLTSGASWDCKKDPVVSLGNGKLKIKFTGTCTTINVGSGENTLDIESVDTLNVGGGKNKITIGTVDTIHLGGAKNVVRWKKAKTGDKPTIQDGAAGNDVAQAK